MEARGAFTAQSASELSFPKAALIRVLEQNDSGWWLGELDTPSGKKQGYFPSNFTKPAISTYFMLNWVTGISDRGSR